MPEHSPILVPVDLTDTSPVAVGHAHHIAQRMGTSVHVLHLVNKERQIEKGEDRLEVFLGKMKAELGEDVPFHHSVKDGDPLEDIAMEAESLKARLIIIGTHGLQGLEYIVGTHAIRIVNSVSVPCIVVQEKPIGPEGYDDIIVPMGSEKEAKQKLGMVANMARLFDSKVHLVLPYEDDEFLKNAQTRNLNYAKGYLKEHNVAFSVTEAADKEKDFSDATVKAAIKENGDLIAIMNFHEMDKMGLFGSETQDVLINKPMIPVLVMNPRMMVNSDMFRITA